MSRGVLTAFLSIAWCGVAGADVFSPFSIADHRLSVRHLVVLERDTPGYTYYLLHPGRHLERLNLQPAQQVEVQVEGAGRRGASHLIAVPIAVEARFGSPEKLAQAAAEAVRDSFPPSFLADLPGVALSGDERVGPMDVRKAVIVTVSIRPGSEGPVFAVESQTTGRTWTTPIIGLCLTGLAVAIGFRRARRKQAA